jgi:hypothetical protein
MKIMICMPVYKLNLTFKVTLKNLVFDFFFRYDCVYLYEFHIFLIGFILLNAYLIVSSNPLRRGVLDTTLCDKVCQ